MKTKIILLIVGAAAITFSFTFAATSHSEKQLVSTSVEDTSAPAGGLSLEEK